MEKIEFNTFVIRTRQGYGHTCKIVIDEEYMKKAGVEFQRWPRHNVSKELVHVTLSPVDQEPKDKPNYEAMWCTLWEWAYHSDRVRGEPVRKYSLQAKMRKLEALLAPHPTETVGPEEKNEETQT